MKSNEHCGCSEYNHLSRRHFLGAAAGFLTVAASPAWLPRVALADSHSSSRDVLVSIFLRGGCDGLTLCVPHGDDDYYRLRPTLAVPRPDSSGGQAALDLDGFFGLPPAMQPLLEAYQDNSLLFVHACGLTGTNRSHFAAMHFMEVGEESPPSGVFTGWLGRHLANTPPSLSGSVLRAVGVGVGLQRTLNGAPDAVPVENLAQAQLAGESSTRGDRRRALRDMYRDADEPFGTSGKSTLDTLSLLQQIDFQSYQPAGGAAYGDGEFGQSLRAAAALIKAEVGVEAIAIDISGWDTHDVQGPLDGQMNTLMGRFAGGLSAFYQDLGGLEGVSLVAMSEFGRNAFENGSAGTDHGYGGAMLAMGEGIRGGRVMAEWPGLRNSQLFDGQDLDITIDYRDILAEILTKRVGNTDIGAVFTDSSFRPQRRGVARRHGSSNTTPPPSVPYKVRRSL